MGLLRAHGPARLEAALAAETDAPAIERLKARIESVRAHATRPPRPFFFLGCFSVGSKRECRSPVL